MSFTAFGPCYKAACSLLPPAMDSLEAKAMMFAIAMQESRWDERRQIGGPARGFFQFEINGILGVLNFASTKPMIHAVLDRLDYDHTAFTSYTAIEHNDVLAIAYARCLLWTVPARLPRRGEAPEGWRQYLSAWRPGAPRRATWDAFFTAAWDMVADPVT